MPWCQQHSFLSVTVMIMLLSHVPLPHQFYVCVFVKDWLKKKKKIQHGGSKNISLKSILIPTTKFKWATPTIETTTNPTAPTVTVVCKIDADNHDDIRRLGSFFPTRKAIWMRWRERESCCNLTCAQLNTH